MKAKKAKAPSKKASPKTRKSETASKQEEETAPVIKRNKTGKILAKSAQESVPEEIETMESDEETEELPPLEQKFTASESVIIRDNSIIKAQAPAVAAGESNEQLRVKLSKTLVRKLREQAADEGVTLDEFVTELLSEGVVLRAWEIVERKNQMKGGAPIGNNRGNGPNAQQNRNGQNNQGQRGNKGHRGMNHSRYQTIMEDKGAFMEYVRGQERNRR
ncbi:MAG: hypothetical protein M3Q07_12125 [Pseudobdellovibrionaceae bacterium]|nr:hypothetical protein [Pseudobdellovibrionaceae bacterium]HYX34090.1 hypothetical protein [Oligoflexus sp.]